MSRGKPAFSCLRIDSRRNITIFSKNERSLPLERNGMADTTVGNKVILISKDP